jgi:hypothetical protein
VPAIGIRFANYLDEKSGGVMNRTKGVTGTALAIALAGALGCESVALVGRPDVDARGSDRADLGRRGELDRNEIVGTVERVDRSDREVVIRTTEGRTTRVRYDSGTVVRTRGRDMAVEDLRPGDMVALNVQRDSRGEQYADIIRMRDRDGFGR